MNPLRTAAILSLAVPSTLVAAAFASEPLLGLVPCEMCWWQRWAHVAAIAPAANAVAFSTTRLSGIAGPAAIRRVVLAMTLAAAALIVLSGVIGAYHAGVEYHWWTGHTACTAPPASGLDGDAFLKDLMSRPLVRCDQAQWSLLGVSMAGWNFIVSTAAAAAIAILALRGARR